MGVKSLLARLAVRRVHVLVVAAAGNRILEVVVDAKVRERGWVVAESPADADVLAVVGTSGPRLTEAIEQVWQQLPGPRVRIQVDERSQVDPAFDQAVVELSDIDRQRDDARHRHDKGDDGSARHSDDAEEHARMHHGGMGHGQMGHGQMDHGQMDHGGMDHGGMDHGSMAPAGIPLAEGADDRDGLEMDVLHLPLGPIMTHWPAGLVVQCTLQGDVVVDAQVDVLDAEALVASGADSTVEAVNHCSVVVDVLALAGAENVAAQARAVRALLVDDELERARAELGPLYRRIRRSSPLRWSLRGLGVLDHDRAEELGVDEYLPALTGDVHDRMLARLSVIGGADGEEGGPFVTPLHWRCGELLIPELIVGLDLAATRLVIASLGIDVAQMVIPAPGEQHG
ncbi:hypothetical protein [Gordonia aquimaris]|uniref:Uncharacterized protein n=1 Tax=Gordonia aquimaris TaxID=2984863 RepID=A0A9X3I4M5_9ACTN|nr:hypothetical protein [Gordonia aquimaris]MCX2963614.1 hypothetical protein [Gordonia aquimaris]